MSQTPSPSTPQRFCTGCGGTLTPGVRFCSSCGTPLGGTVAPASGLQMLSPQPASSSAPWIVAGLLTVVAVAAVVYAGTDRTAPEAPVMANGAPVGSNGAPGQGVDISQMTLREQFTRLSDRVTAAAENGDTTTVTQFTPMALSAYTNLPPGDRDIDSRYHTAMIMAQVGMFTEALALADTILAKAPNNLMAYFVQATVADFQKDGPRAEAARAAYRKHYDAQIATKRDEYTVHSAMLERFKSQPAPK